jgi:hypothetical protein
MVVMKRLALIISCSAALVCGADLSSVHTVYLLKMGKGLDQYLANRLTNEHVFQVVTDPKMADAVLTDQIGEGLQVKLEELFPSPEAAKPEPKPPKKDAKEKGGKKGAKDDEEVSTIPLLGDTVNKLSNPATNSSFGRARGMVFLVDAKSRQVIWSAFDEPKDSNPKQLDKTALDLVNRIKHDLKGK